ncbi:MAG: hypothetical protein E7189_06925 [Erysipelotrichaceae bacterium]|nr:hypothetical protein [Erysipelotrichaceae bacterium]
MGNWSLLYDLLKPFIENFQTFAQSLALIVAAAMAIYFKIREMSADVQEDQMWNQKTKKTFIALVFVFVIPTIIKIAEAYFKKG